MSNRPSSPAHCPAPFVLRPLSFPRAFAVAAPIATVLALAVGVLSGTAGALENQQAVRAAQDGLTERDRFPWYDPETNQVSPVRVRPNPAPPEIRNWEWTPRKSQPKQTNWRWPTSVMETLAWILLGALLIALIVLIVRAFYRRGIERVSHVLFTSDRETATCDADRVEKLPFPVKRPQSDLLGEARRNYDAGNYGEAVIYLFSYQLVHLDKHNLVRLAKGKTNRQYLREIRSRGTIVRIVRDTMTRFEDVFFGGHHLDRARFEVCWNSLDQFHADVQKAAVAGLP